MPLNPETHNLQTKLSHYCRTEELPSIPGVREGRVGTYRRLVFGVVKGALENAYPVTKKLLGEERWLQLVNEFFANHDASSVQLWHFPQELLSYAKERALASRYECPYFDDLLLFEWVEIEVFMMADLESPAVVSDGDPLKDELVLNPHFKLLPFEYPVFRKVEGEIGKQQGKYYLHVYRDPHTDKVRFSELSPLAVCVVQLLSAEPLTGKDILEASATHLSLEPTDEFFLKGSELLNRLLSDAILLGFLKE